jgi:hypothetical protein
MYYYGGAVQQAQINMALLSKVQMVPILFSQFMVDFHYRIGNWVFCFQMRWFFRHAKRAETTVQVYRGKNQE